MKRAETRSDDKPNVRTILKEYSKIFSVKGKGSMKIFKDSNRIESHKWC